MRLIPAVILCALLGIVYWVGATVFTHRIQTDITERSTAAISPFKADVNLLVDGRDVTITGLVNTEDQKQQAEQKIDSVWGVRASQNLLAVREPYKFHATYSEATGLIVSGAVDTPDAISYMNQSISPIVTGGKLSTNARPMINSGQKLAAGASALLMLQQGSVAIDERQLLLTGDAEDETVKNNIETSLRKKRNLIEPLEIVTNINVVNFMTKACRELLDSAIDQSSILFEVDKYTVRDKYKGTVTAYTQVLKTCPGDLLIEAHADQDGSENYNQILSQKRADAVADALIDDGTVADRIHTFSYGETRPIASNESTRDKAYNRRVDIEYVHSRIMPTTTSIQQPIISSQSPE